MLYHPQKKKKKPRPSHIFLDYVTPIHYHFFFDNSIAYDLNHHNNRLSYFWMRKQIIINQRSSLSWWKKKILIHIRTLHVWFLLFTCLRVKIASPTAFSDGIYNDKLSFRYFSKKEKSWRYKLGWKKGNDVSFFHRFWHFYALNKKTCPRSFFACQSSRFCLVFFMRDSFHCLFSFVKWERETFAV